MNRLYERLAVGTVLRGGATDRLEVTDARDDRDGQVVKVRQLSPMSFDEAYNDWFPTVGLCLSGWQVLTGEKL